MEDFTLDLPSSVPTNMIDERPTERGVLNFRSQLESQITQQMEEARRLQAEAAAQEAPTEREATLQSELDNLAVAEQQALLNEEKRPVAIEFTTGRQREIQRQAALDRLSASTQLKQEQQARQSRLTTIGQRLGIVGNNIEDLLGLTEQFSNLEKQEREDTRDALVTMMDFSNGKTYDELDPQSQQALIDLTSRLPVTLGAVQQALTNNKVALEEQQKMAQYDAALKSVELQNEILKGQKTIADMDKAANSIRASSAGAGLEANDFDTFRQVQLAFARIPTQLKNSNAEREYFIEGIQKGLSQGYSPYEVADIVAGFDISDQRREEPFVQNMRDLMSQVNFQGTQIAEVARLLNNGNDGRVVRMIENELLDQSRALDPEGFVSEANVLTTLRYAQQIAQEINAAQGVIVGKSQKVLGKLKGKDAAALQTKIENLTAELRNKLVGSAATKQELRMIEPLIPSLDDRVDTLVNKVNNLNDRPLIEYNSFRAQVGLPPITRTAMEDMDQRVNLYKSANFTQSEIASAEQNTLSQPTSNQTTGNVDISDLDMSF